MWSPQFAMTEMRLLAFAANRLMFDIVVNDTSTIPSRSPSRNIPATRRFPGDAAGQSQTSAIKYAVAVGVRHAAEHGSLCAAPVISADGEDRLTVSRTQSG